MNKDIFKKAFENVKPSKELVSSVLELQNAPAVPKRTKRQSFYYKPRRIGIIGVCAVFVIGVTAAAAEFIDFEAVFGDYIVVKNSELANSLVGKVKNFKYKVSDDDYKIEIKGVTGTDRSMLGVAEISRVDGTPVIDHFINPTEERALAAFWEHTVFDGSGGFGSGVNDEGNIEFHFDISNDSGLIGKKLKVTSKDFYPAETYYNFMRDNNISYMEYGDFSGYVQTPENGYVDHHNFVPADIDDSGIIALELEWEFSFIYKPSEAALKTKTLLDPEEDFVLYEISTEIIRQEDGSGRADPDSRVDLETTADCTHIEVGPMNGRIKFEYEITEYHKQSFDDDRSTHFDGDKNVLFLITADGGTIPVEFGAGTGSGGGKGKIFKWDYTLVYPGENDKKEIIETENVTAISINGTVYELK